MDIDRAVKNLAKLVYDTRARMNLSQRKFAKLFKTTSSSISNLENGNYLDLPEHRTLNRFATDILKIKYSRLIEILEQEEVEEVSENFQDATSISKAQLIAGLHQLRSLDEALDLHHEFSQVFEKLRDAEKNHENN